MSLLLCPRLFRNVLRGDIKRIAGSLLSTVNNLFTYPQIESTRTMAAFPKRNPSEQMQVLKKLRNIKPQGYFLLTLPVATFALGVWQIKRSMWKSNVIEELKSRVHRTPRTLPDTLEEISKLEYCPVKVQGYFDHSREILLGPRTQLNSKKPASTLLSHGTNNGYFVITPFKPNDRDYYILVNRGWIPNHKKDPLTRLGGQIEGEVVFTGLVRLTEKRPLFVHANNPSANVWIYRDLNEMSAALGNDVAPISIDATEDFTLPDGPIGGQTLIITQNSHFNYAITWLSLSLLSGILWWQTYVPISLRSVRYR